MHAAPGAAALMMALLEGAEASLFEMHSFASTKEKALWRSPGAKWRQ